MRLLHDGLYATILQPYLRTDIEYIPHIGLGHFIKNEKYDYQNPTQCDLDEARYKKALEKAKNLDLSYSTTIEKVYVIEIDDRFTYTKDVKQFFLGS